MTRESLAEVSRMGGAPELVEDAEVRSLGDVRIAWSTQRGRAHLWVSQPTFIISAKLMLTTAQRHKPSGYSVTERTPKTLRDTSAGGQSGPGDGTLLFDSVCFCRIQDGNCHSV